MLGGGGRCAPRHAVQVGEPGGAAVPVEVCGCTAGFLDGSVFKGICAQG